jgi:hypothetical protein
MKPWLAGKAYRTGRQPTRQTVPRG